MEIRDEKTRQLFIKYLEEHPDQRFMQAVRNFLGVPFLVATGSVPKEEGNDTFYWECDFLLGLRQDIEEDDGEKPAEPKRYRLLKDLPTFKAGEVFELGEGGSLFRVDHTGRGEGRVMAYHKQTLDKFPNILEEWFEEIKPAEPLIKDEKIRKAVRAWMQMLGAESARICYHDDVTFPYTTIYARWDDTFEYRLEIPAKIGAQRIAYTIAELCGEEEE